MEREGVYLVEMESTGLGESDSVGLKWGKFNDERAVEGDFIIERNSSATMDGYGKYIVIKE